jgi:DNA-binding MarR family transcriptional regulator
MAMWECAKCGVLCHDHEAACWQCGLEKTVAASSSRSSEAAGEEENPETSEEIERDELFEEAKRIVLQNGSASTSFLQRRLGLGYTRAARIIDQLEAAGVISPAEGSKPREILMSGDNSAEAVGGDAAQEIEDAAEALIALGYKKQKAEEAIRKMLKSEQGRNVTVEEMIRGALKYL